MSEEIKYCGKCAWVGFTDFHTCLDQMDIAESWEFEVKYHVYGVELHRTVIAADEIQAWERVKKDIITREFWLETVFPMRRRC